MSCAEETELTKLVKEVLSSLKLIFVLMSILLAVVVPTCFIRFPARKPLPSGRGGSAASSLLFDVTLDDLQRGSSTRDCAVRR